MKITITGCGNMGLTYARAFIRRLKIEMVPLFQGTMNVGAEITTPHPAPVNS